MLARIMCLIIVVLEARGLFLSIGDRRWKVFAFYTQLSNIATAISAVFVLAFGETPFYDSSAISQQLHAAHDLFCDELYPGSHGR